jgi:acyl-CoA thioester hydrolase
LAATNELITIHIDLSERRSTPFAPEMMDRLEAMMQQHKHLPRPDKVGRTIGIRRKTA